MSFILYVYLGLLSIIWGSSFYFISILVEPFGPWGVTFLRCACGAFVLLVVLLIRWKSLQLKGLPWLKLIVIGLLNSALPWTLIAFSQTMLSSGMTSSLNALTPIWTVILGIMLFQSKSTRQQWIGVLAGFAGLILLLNIDMNTFTINHPVAIGAMMLSTMCFGFGAHLSKKYLQQCPVYLISFTTLVSGSLFAGFLMLWTHPLPVAALYEVPNILAVIGLGAFGSGIAYLLYYSLLQRGSAQFATMVTYLVPPFAILWGHLLLDEPLSLTLFGGLALILSGVYLAGKSKVAS